MAQFLKVSDSIVYSSLIVILYHKEAKRLIELWFVVILISPVFPWLSLLCLICLLVPDSVTMFIVNLLVCILMGLLFIVRPHRVII